MPDSKFPLLGGTVIHGFQRVIAVGRKITSYHHLHDFFAVVDIIARGMIDQTGAFMPRTGAAVVPVKSGHAICAGSLAQIFQVVFTERLGATVTAVHAAHLSDINGYTLV